MKKIGKLLCTKRIRKSTISDRKKIDEFYSDHSRIIYSSSFRLLQQKTQVFPLDLNKSVRTRLTHSIEVSDLGRTLAWSIYDALLEKELVNDTEPSEKLRDCFAITVENACLIHDIGNPPFGHFGETSIRMWFKDNYERLLKKANVNICRKDSMYDFLQFDGNPQGIRILTRGLSDGLAGQMNLTFATILSMIKYPTVPKKEKAKSGFFYSEQDMIKKIYGKVGLVDDYGDKIGRFPLSYIVEAADDIAYCLSDIADGIQKRILSSSEFEILFKENWIKLYSDDSYIDILFPKKKYLGGCNYKFDISVKWSKMMMDEISNVFVNNFDKIIVGEAEELVSYTEHAKKILKVLKDIARLKLYRAPEVEHVELCGLKVIDGLLDHFGKLLELSKDEFFQLVNGDSPAGKNLDIEWRIINRIGISAKTTYEFGILTHNDYEEEKDYWKKYREWDVESRKKQFCKAYEVTDPDIEWFYRAHMIVDYITGMTDDYALKLFQIFNGISIK